MIEKQSSVTSDTFLAASVVTISEDLEADTNNKRTSITRSVSSEIVFNRDYTNKIFRDNINRFNSKEILVKIS